MDTRLRSRISTRFAAIASSATPVIDVKVKALKVQERLVIRFGVGEPSFPTLEPIVEVAVRAARKPVVHRYTSVADLPELHSTIVEKALRGSGYEIDPTQILMTNGDKRAVF